MTLYINGAAPGLAPSGAAGGDLAGTYPNPTATDLTISSEARGDILARNASAWTRLAAGNSGQVLETMGAGADPAWVNSATVSTKGVITSTGNSTGLTLTDQNTWYQIVTFDTNKVSRIDFTADQANSRITAASGYNEVTEFEYACSFITDSNNQIIEIGVSEDGGTTILTPLLQRKVGTGTDVGNAGMQTIATIDASGGAVQLTLWARNTSSAGVILTIQELYFEAKEA